jgi:Type II CAAX prenyl endopeptidase Rce1-like
MAAKAGPQRGRSSQTTPIPVPDRYYDSTRRPIYNLAFLFPLVAAYEFGAMMIRPLAMPERSLVAPALIERAVAWFGPAGAWVPGVALLITLVAWQVLSRQGWQIRLWIPPLMLVESAVLAIPLLVLSQFALQAGGEVIDGLKVRVLLALGASIYEELVFRFLLVSLLLWLAQDALALPTIPARVAAIVCGGLAFAACHVQPIGAEAFEITRFTIRAVAGAYLGLLFLTRGLGICTGCHAVFNLYLLLRA